jgi:hypothetical protein
MSQSASFPGRPAFAAANSRSQSHGGSSHQRRTATKTLGPKARPNWWALMGGAILAFVMLIFDFMVLFFDAHLLVRMPLWALWVARVMGAVAFGTLVAFLATPALHRRYALYTASPIWLSAVVHWTIVAYGPTLWGATSAILQTGFVALEYLAIGYYQHHWPLFRGMAYYFYD